MIGIRVAKQIAISKTMFKKLLNLPRCLSKEDVTEAERQVPQKLDNVSSQNLVQSNFVAGNIKKFYENQKKFANDHIILSIIKYGFKSNFTDKIQYQHVAKILHDMLETEMITQKDKTF